MTKTKKPQDTKKTAAPTKHQQVIALLRRDGGATLNEMAALASWLPHSTRAFMTGLRKKGHVIDSEKADGVRRYHIKSAA